MLGRVRKGAVDSAPKAYNKAISLLPPAIWLGQGIHDQHYSMRSVYALAVDAAAFHIQNAHLEEAVESLEYGRFVLFSQLLQLRNDFSALRDVAPNLFKELSEARQQLESTSHSVRAEPALRGPSAGDSQKLRQRWRDLISKVHEVPGFSDFLQPPSFRDLCQGMTPSHGPVVLLNCSELGCDALIIISGSTRLKHVPLTGMSEGRAMQLRVQLAALGAGYRNRNPEETDPKMGFSKNRT